MAHIHRDDAEERGGFNFDNVRRNEMLRGSGLAFKNAMKTGTTISGVCFAGGVVLGGGHAVYERRDGGGQELREDPLHRAQHLLLRRGDGGGHGGGHGYER